MHIQSAKQASGSGNREAKGFLFLISLLLIPFLCQYTYRAFFYQPEKQDLTSIQYLMDSCTQQSSFTTSVEYKSKQGYESGKGVYKKANAVKSIDINSADTTLFKSLPGIGSVYATRIVKYRNLLGGFVEITQLKEVYGIKPELFDQIKSQLFISTKMVKKIAADSLWKRPYAFYHPYLSKELKARIQAENKKNTYSAAEFKEIIEENSKKLNLYIVWE